MNDDYPDEPVARIAMTGGRKFSLIFLSKSILFFLKILLIRPAKHNDCVGIRSRRASSSIAKKEAAKMVLQVAYTRKDGEKLQWDFESM